MIKFLQIQASYDGNVVQVVGQLAGECHRIGITPVRAVRNFHVDELGTTQSDALLIGLRVTDVTADLVKEMAGAWGGTEPLF